MLRRKKNISFLFQRQTTTSQFSGPSPVTTPTELFQFDRMAKRFSLEILSHILHFVIPELMLIHPVLAQRYNIYGDE
jgi:hypothetical protein